MNSLNNLDLKIVIAISQETSLTSTARRLGLTLSVVSQRLSKMEERLNIKIAQRPGVFKLTHHGARILSYALRVQSELERCELDLREISNLSESVFTIMGSASAILGDTPLAIKHILAKFPKQKIATVFGDQSRSVKSVIDGDTDVALVCSNSGVAGLRFLPYKVESICILVPNNHPLIALAAANRPRGVLIADVYEKFPFIGLTEDNPLYAATQAFLKERKLNVSFRVTASSYEVQAHLCAYADAGAVVMLLSMAKRFEKLGLPVKVIPVVATRKGINFFLCVRERKLRTPVCQEFVNQMTTYFKMPDY